MPVAAAPPPLPIAPMDNRFLFEQFEIHKQRGLAAHGDGAWDTARQELLQAAKFLYQLAGKTEEGSLRQSRMENADKLVEMAKRIRETPPERRDQLTAKDPDGKRAGAGASDEDAGAAVGDQWLLPERPTTRFEDIKGLDDVKETIQLRMILPLQHPDRAKRYGIELGGGMLLYGPPGTGKTMLAKAIAGEIDAAFYTVTPADVLSRWVGDAERNIASLFEAAHRHDLAVVFMDEVEALLPKRDGTESPVMQRLVPQLLGELEGITSEGKSPLLFIGATNKPWAMDEAVLRPGRFDEKVYVPLPDADARKAILYHHLQDRPIDADMDFGELTARLEGYSGADIVGLIRRASGRTFQRAIQSDQEIPIRQADLTMLIEQTPPSVTPGLLQRYADFKTG